MAQALPGPFWSLATDDVLAAVGSSTRGLGAVAARERLEREGPNAAAPPPRLAGARLFLRQFESPILLVLVGATVLAMVLGDVLDGAIILAIIVLSLAFIGVVGTLVGKQVADLLKNSSTYVNDTVRFVNDTFNAITVDGECSTNDCVMMLANGASGVTIDEALLKKNTLLHEIIVK